MPADLDDTTMLPYLVRRDSFLSTRRIYGPHLTVNFKPDKSWPPSRVPTDVFFLISQYLTKADLARLRLVNREFALKLDYLFFYKVSVSLSPDFYVANTQKEDDVGVFERVGANITKFGITLDIDEATLLLPPLPANPICPKLFGSGEHDRLDRDRVFYQRLRDTELLVCRRWRMVKAFSHLTAMKELALSFNTGLGWVSPPVFNRFQPIFLQPPVVFRKRHLHLSPHQYLLPNDIVRSGTRVAPGPYVLSAACGERAVTTWYGTDGSRFCETCRHQSQIELLAETSSVIQRFFSSFFLAVIDNGQVFQNVHTLTFSGISSGLLHNLNNLEFFACFRGLKSLSILVYADWRKFDEDRTSLQQILPSEARSEFYQILQEQILPLSNIESLTLGYIGGGEHAHGALVRNRNILPAPIMREPATSAMGKARNSVIWFKHVKSLTFENCWFAPSALIQFLTHSKRSRLENLVFDSCSLASTPGRKDHALIRCGHGTYPAWRKYNRRVPSGIWISILAQFGPYLPLTDPNLPASSQFSDLKLPKRKPLDNLRRMDFVSCGYVLLGPFYNQTNLVVDEKSNDLRRSETEKWLREAVRDVDVSNAPVYAPFTKQVYDGDNLLGSIIQSIDEREEYTLAMGYNFMFGWPAGDGLRRLVEEDGWKPGGTGRFTGRVARPEEKDAEA
ncbi:hypothetical protein D8B26_002769 [Coccidioides posadasii str. Silveira]|uniref:Uncharacterized protein n=2 Tax=Coccidioides posadasii TaxID=199306 RepID=E9CYB9_COCPS|nr:conserved hypothetical protein [Coccidioides posadasii str. Silveira]QVM08071.1 hypothetical protein D8B26_002769 [Coccidioides posadasii str. Silveira]